MNPSLFSCQFILNSFILITVLIDLSFLIAFQIVSSFFLINLYHHDHFYHFLNIFDLVSLVDRMSLVYRESLCYLWNILDLESLFWNLKYLFFLIPYVNKLNQSFSKMVSVIQNLYVKETIFYLGTHVNDYLNMDSQIYSNLNASVQLLIKLELFHQQPRPNHVSIHDLKNNKNLFNAKLLHQEEWKIQICKHLAQNQKNHW